MNKCTNKMYNHLIQTLYNKTTWRLDKNVLRYQKKSIIGDAEKKKKS